MFLLQAARSTARNLYLLKLLYKNLARSQMSPEFSALALQLAASLIQQ
jgi:hypothetical protein